MVQYDLKKKMFYYQTLFLSSADRITTKSLIFDVKNIVEELENLVKLFKFFSTLKKFKPFLNKSE